MAPFILPWLKSRQIPEISVTRSAKEIIVHQLGDVFKFPFQIGISLKNRSSSTTTLDIHQAEQDFELSKPEVSGYVLDPYQKLWYNIRKKLG